MRQVRSAVTLCILLLSTVPALAQTPPSLAAAAGSKSLDVPRLAGAIEIDGVPDEALWQQAALVEDFHQFLPNEYVAPTQRTEVRVFYTEDSLYVTARLFETDPAAVTAQVLRQGQNLNGDDLFALILDPYLDRRNGYRFEVNPNGVR